MSYQGYEGYYSLIRKNEPYPWESVERGMSWIGLQSVGSITPKTVLVTWTPWKSSSAHVLGTRHSTNGGKWLVMENGYIDSVKGVPYYTMGIDGFNGRGDHRNDNSPPDRWESFGLEIKPWRTDGEYILVVGQFGHKDTIISMPVMWPDQILRDLRRFTRRRIIYRPKKSRPRLPTREFENVTIDNESSLKDQIENAWCVVVYSSKAAVEALRLGIPAFVCGPCHIAKGWVGLGVSHVDNPYYPSDRKTLFNNLAYAQWNREEIERGIPITRLL